MNYSSGYGEFGIITPKSTRKNFVHSWYNSPWAPYVNYYELFNKKGNPTYEVWFYKGGDTVSTYRYKYDKNDNLIQYKEIYEPDDYTVRNYTYNYKNKITSTLFYASYDPNFYSYREYIHDSVGNLIKIKNFDEGGEVSTWLYVYDKKGRKTKTFLHRPYIVYKKGRGLSLKMDSVGTTRIVHKFFYGLKNKIIEKQDFSTEIFDTVRNKRPGKVKYKYNNGLLKKELHIRDTVYNYREYNYDNLGRKIKMKVELPKYPDENETTTYSYYKQTDFPSKIIQKGKGKTITAKFDYTFDQHDNWTKQVKTVNGKTYVLTREITYYQQ